jgi:hypothetical protein
MLDELIYLTTLGETSRCKTSQRIGLLHPLENSTRENPYKQCPYLWDGCHIMTHGESAFEVL